MRRTWLIFSQAVTVAVALIFVIAALKPDWLQRRQVSGLPSGLSINAVQPVALTPELGVMSPLMLGRAHRRIGWSDEALGPRPL